MRVITQSPKYTSLTVGTACIQVIDFYLDEEREDNRKELVELSKFGDKDAKRRIMGYIREAQRTSSCEDDSNAVYRYTEICTKALHNLISYSALRSRILRSHKAMTPFTLKLVNSCTPIFQPPTWM